MNQPFAHQRPKASLVAVFLRGFFLVGGAVSVFITGWFLVMRVAFGQAPDFRLNPLNLCYLGVNLFALAFLACLLWPAVRRALGIFAGQGDGRPGLPGRLLAWAFNPRMLGRWFFAFACLSTFVALFYAEENWRGKRAWEQFKQTEAGKDAMGAGEAPRPVSVPDAQNFARTPFLVALVAEKSSRPGAGLTQAARGQTSSNTPASIPLSQGQTAASNWQHCLSALAPGTDTGDFWHGRVTDLQKYQERLRGASSSRLRLVLEEPAADILIALQQIEPELNELRRASLRPYAQFSAREDASAGLLGEAVAARTIAQIFSLAASAELALGHSEAAFTNILVVFRVAEAAGSQSTFLGTMIQAAILNLSLQAFWEGAAAGQWSDRQLEAFAKLFGSVDVLAAVDHQLHLRAQALLSQPAETYFSRIRDELRRQLRDSRGQPFAADYRALYWYFLLAPRGWLYRTQVAYARDIQELRLSACDLVQHRLLLEKFRQLDRRPSLAHPYRFVFRRAIVNFAKGFESVARTQTAVDEALVACALERYRHAQGQYPETLSLLSPQFIDRLPHDMIDGDPLKYRRTADGHFILYSVGWDGIDDGGKPEEIWSGAQPATTARGDWVWHYPEKQALRGSMVP